MWFGLARRIFSGDFGNRLYVFQLAAAAATDDIDETVLRERVHPLRHFSRGLCILTEFVREPSVRVTDNGDVRQFRHLRKVRTDLLGTKTAVQSDSEQVGMADRVPERFNRLS